MAFGRYTVMDGAGHPVGTETFRCAPGPAGWRYVAEIQTSSPEQHRETLDLAVDATWVPVRLHVSTGSHRLELSAGTDRLRGQRDGQPVDLPWRPPFDLDYLSPCFNAVTANRLRQTTEIEVVFLKPVTCEPVTVGQRYERGDDEEVVTPVGRFQARRWQYTALTTGWSRLLWVAADIVVAYQDVFELVEYEPGATGPPVAGPAVG
jgi:hypothetical protein